MPTLLERKSDQVSGAPGCLVGAFVTVRKPYSRVSLQDLCGRRVGFDSSYHHSPFPLGGVQKLTNTLPQVSIGTISFGQGTAASEP